MSKVTAGAVLAADKREIIFAPTIFKFEDFGAMAKHFSLTARDVVLTHKPIFDSAMKALNLPCQFAYQEEFGVGEPSEEMIQTMYDTIPYDSYDRVVAVGGGAIMDLCKLLGCQRPDSVHNLFFKRFPITHEKEVIAVPTTCGTGSECTNISVAIVKDEKEGKLTGGDTKLGLVSDDIIPNKVCLIPDLMKSLPYPPFIFSAIDALIHATESFLSPARRTTTSKLFSVGAIEIILQGFCLMRDKGQEARLDYLDEFLTASLYGGLAFLKAGCATVHAMSFPLGGTYHVPHGESNYMLFHPILTIYDELKPEGEIKAFKKMIADILGGSEADALITLDTLLQQLIRRRTLQEVGFQEEDITAFPQSVKVNQERLISNSYVPMTTELMERVYRECYGN